MSRVDEIVATSLSAADQGVEDLCRQLETEALAGGEAVDVERLDQLLNKMRREWAEGRRTTEKELRELLAGMDLDNG